MTDKKKELPRRDPQVPAYLRTIGVILQTFSPVLAARYAAILFGTPIKHRMPDRERNMDAETRQERITLPGCGKEIVVYHYGDQSKKVLLVHGWSGRGTQLYKIADAVREKGFSTISFDAPAHGKAGGKRTHMLQFVEAVQEIDKRYGPFEFGIGHSLGAMSLLNASVRGVAFKKLVLLGSGNRVSDIMQAATNALGLKPVTGIQMKRLFDEISGIDTETLSAEIAAQKVDCPVLVLHDEEDKDVPVIAAERIHRALPNSELHITKGLGHNRILRDKQVIRKLVDFLVGSF